MKTKDIQIGQEYAHHTGGHGSAERVVVLEKGAKEQRTIYTDRWPRKTWVTGILVQKLNPKTGEIFRVHYEGKDAQPMVVLPQHVLHSWDEEIRREALRQERKAKTEAQRQAYSEGFEETFKALQALVPELELREYSDTSYTASTGSRRLSIDLSKMRKLVEALQK